MSNRILSYRGLMADGGQDTILLSTKKGEIGYRLIKFELLPNTPGDVNQDSTVQIFTVEQTAVAQNIDFSNTTLLGAATYGSDDATYSNNDSRAVIFDHIIINQDIFVTHKDTAASESINYYIELEVIKLSEHDAMVTTIQSIRNG